MATYTYVTTDDQDAALALQAPQQGLADAAAMFAALVDSNISAILSSVKQQQLAQLQTLPLATIQSLVTANTGS
jgi:hypothetical protein